MWVINLLLLWLVPATLGLVVLSRTASGTSALTNRERRLVFNGATFSGLSPWLATKFALLAVTFFAIGLLEGVALPNLPFAWMALFSALTGGAAVVLVALWLRSASVPPWNLLFNRIVKRRTGKSRSVDGFSTR